LLAGNGRLVKRPIVTDGKQATVGFDAETFAKAWR
jgi:arsenate reductase